jgi:cytochrome c
MDIAKRYPVKDGYIALLARRIIVGGSGAWGYSVMAPHADFRKRMQKQW